jgi:two-component system, NarL family, response regulator DevR
MADTSVASIGVVIIDDHKMFGESLARLLRDENGIVVLGIATSGAEGIELVARAKPKVVLVDYRMPERDGTTIASEIKQGDADTMVVMLTGSADDRVLLAAIDAGCSGFLTKDRAAAEVVDTVRAAALGEAIISPAMLARLLPQLSRKHCSLGDDLSERERSVLGYFAKGWTNKLIANEMNLSVNTIRNYGQAVLTKVGAHSKLEAVATAVREGVIALPTGCSSPST